MDWRLLLHPRAGLNQAALLIARDANPPDAGGGGRRSNRRRFSNKQAVVQETEKPGVSVAQAYGCHGVATSTVFRSRLEFGLTARKAPQLAMVTARRRRGQ
ncbi:hypothetical protein [Bradyrhizobium brasilense]|uniref:hypothetical protein n=1 Tax=Bradyrhizobium brasilense TaxID=1419277 RepID=UPI000B8099AD|nr:hypothetical protein [Bradyrhizobium brasilense]